MALVPSINLCLKSNCVDLVLTETTGQYSLSNLGGYGAPNVTLGQVQTAVLMVTNPSGVQYTINLYNTFPTSNSLFEYIIPLSLIGSPTTIADGYWTFVYTITGHDGNGVPFTYTATSGNVFSCSVNCCIQNILSKIKLNVCDTCDKEYLYEEYVKAVALKDSLDSAAECGDAQYITDTLNILTKLCNKNNCNSCN